MTSYTKTSDKLFFYKDYVYNPETLKSYDYDVKTSYIETIKPGDYNVSNKYSIVGVKLVLKNKWRKYIMLYYVPTTLIVITSWVFFLLPSTSYPARTALLVTVFLLLINIFSNVVNDTPSSSDGGRTFPAIVIEFCYQKSLNILFLFSA